MIDGQPNQGLQAMLEVSCTHDVNQNVMHDVNHDVMHDVICYACIQARAEGMRTALRMYKAAKADGDFTPLENYEGFAEPYSEAALALFHGFFPFPFSHYNASQRARSLQDRVVNHPWVIAGGQSVDVDAGEVYQRECPPLLPFPFHS